MDRTPPAERTGTCVLCKRKVSLLVYLLVSLFGIGSWLAINGIWMELPVLVDRAPEKWSLPSYLTVITELANIGPLIYAIGNKFYPKYVHERTTVCAITVLGVVASSLLAFFWDKTSYVFGSERSSALFILSFFVALVDCTSTVTFLPFMAIFPEFYMSALFTGENMSSLLPSFLALIQGIDKRHSATRIISNNGTHRNATITVFTGLNFGPKYFFLFLAFMLATCGAAFVALNFLPQASRHHVMKYSEFQQKQSLSISESSGRGEMQSQDAESDGTGLLDSSYLLAREHSNSLSVSLASFAGLPSETQISSSNTKLICLLLIQGWINCISNGVISQIQAFACEPYGPTAYHLGKKIYFVIKVILFLYFIRLL